MKTPITDGQALLIMILIFAAGIAFGLIVAHYSGTFPFKKKVYKLTEESNDPLLAPGSRVVEEPETFEALGAKVFNERKL
jgi:hypothetical protein